MFNRRKRKPGKIISPRKLIFDESSSISDSLAECSINDHKVMDLDIEIELQQLLMRKKKLLEELRQIIERIEFLKKLIKSPNITTTPIGALSNSLITSDGPPAHSSAYDQAKHNLEYADESLPSPIKHDETFFFGGSSGDISILRESNENNVDDFCTPDNCKLKNYDESYMPANRFSNITPFKLYSHWSQVSGIAPLGTSSYSIEEIAAYPENCLYFEVMASFKEVIADNMSDMKSDTGISDRAGERKRRKRWHV